MSSKAWMLSWISPNSECTLLLYVNRLMYDPLATPNENNLITMQKTLCRFRTDSAESTAVFRASVPLRTTIPRLLCSRNLRLLTR